LDLKAGAQDWLQCVTQSASLMMTAALIHVYEEWSVVALAREINPHYDQLIHSVIR